MNNSYIDNILFGGEKNIKDNVINGSFPPLIKKELKKKKKNSKIKANINVKLISIKDIMKEREEKTKDFISL